MGNVEEPCTLPGVQMSMHDPTFCARINHWHLPAAKLDHLATAGDIELVQRGPSQWAVGRSEALLSAKQLLGELGSYRTRESRHVALWREKAEAKPVGGVGRDGAGRLNVRLSLTSSVELKWCAHPGTRPLFNDPGGTSCCSAHPGRPGGCGLWVCPRQFFFENGQRKFPLGNGLPLRLNLRHPAAMAVIGTQMGYRGKGRAVRGLLSGLVEEVDHKLGASTHNKTLPGKNHCAAWFLPQIWLQPI